MSQENVEIVRRLYEAMNDGDRPTIAELAHPDAEWIPDSRVGEGPVQGRESVIRFFYDRAEMFGQLHTEIERVSTKDEKVLALIRVSGRGNASGAGFEIRVAHLWTLRDGLVVRGEGYGNRDDALEAAGLSQ